MIPKTLLRSVVIPPLRGYFRYCPIRTGKVTVWKYLAAHLWWLESRAKANTLFGGTLEVDARDTCGRFIYYFGIWEPSLTTWIQGRLKHGDCFIDVGANIGYFSLLASTLVGQSGTVVSVEAVQRTFNVLRRNLDANNARNVRGMNMAVWDKEETLSFFISADMIDGTSTAMPAQAEKWKLDHRCDVRAAPLSSLVTPDETAAARLIKIDVEGAEIQAISGLASMLDGGRSDLEVVMEISTKLFDDVAAFFRKHGFFAYHMENDYSAARYIDGHAAKRLYRLENAPMEFTEVDVVFSRIDAPSLS